MGGAGGIVKDTVAEHSARRYRSFSELAYDLLKSGKPLEAVTSSVKQTVHISLHFSVIV